MSGSTVYCVSCLSPLWRCVELSNGQPVVVPATTEVPAYSDGLHQCPFCSQNIYIERSGYHLRMIRNDHEGFIRVA